MTSRRDSGAGNVLLESQTFDGSRPLPPPLAGRFPEISAGFDGLRNLAAVRGDLAPPVATPRSPLSRLPRLAWQIDSDSSAPSSAPSALSLRSMPSVSGDKDDLETKLAAIEQRGGKVEDLTARFEQHKHTALLREPMVSSGTVKVRAGRVLWETKSPRASMMGIEEKRAVVLYSQQKSAEIYPLRGEMQLLGASPLPRIAKLREVFEITEADASDLAEALRDDGGTQEPRRDGGGTRAPEGALGLALAPRPGPMRDYIERVRALVDPSIPALIALEIVDVDGDRTVIRFTDIRINQGLTEADVTLDLPSDIEISYPAGRPDSELPESKEGGR